MSDTIAAERGGAARNPLAACLFVLLGGPLAHVYNGRFRRALGIQVLGWAALPSALAALLYLPWGRWMVAGVAAGVAVYWLALLADAWIVARQMSGRPLKWYQRGWMYLLCFIGQYAATLALALTLRQAWVEAFSIPSRAMAQTLAPGDRILVDHLRYRFVEPRHGDLVVFHPPDESNEVSYVQRVIGLPGDLIEVRDMRVYRNGEPLDEPYVYYREPKPPDLDHPFYAPLLNSGPHRLAEDELFLMGDNRYLSRDSRIFGPVSLDAVLGRAEIIYYSHPPSPREDEFVPRSNPPNPEPQVTRWSRVGARLDGYSTP